MEESGGVSAESLHQKRISSAAPRPVHRSSRSGTPSPDSISSPATSMSRSKQPFARLLIPATTLIEWGYAPAAWHWAVRVSDRLRDLLRADALEDRVSGQFVDEDDDVRAVGSCTRNDECVVFKECGVGADALGC